MKVVAEGVETEEQFAILLEMDCQFGQGFLFSKPLSHPQIDELIANILKLAQESPGTHFSLPAMLSN